MKIFNLRNLSFFFILTGASIFSHADNYIAIGKEGKVFDEANPKYVTLNQKNEEVKVQPGMVFKKSESQPGWIMIEYSPGLRAYVPDNITITATQDPVEGEYVIFNDSSKKLKASKTNGQWEAIVDGKKYMGNQYEKIVIFTDDSSYPSFSLVNIANETIVMSYDNNITNFF